MLARPLLLIIALATPAATHAQSTGETGDPTSPDATAQGAQADPQSRMLLMSGVNHPPIYLYLSALVPRDIQVRTRNRRMREWSLPP